VFTSIVVERPACCRETPGGLHGTVTGPSGAVVPKARVVLTSTAMVGSKELITDISGYYRFTKVRLALHMPQ
jgi:Carboxypeptidase regulatory-like domain